MDSVKNWKRKLKGEKFLLYHLPSTIYYLPSTIYYLPSTIYHLPSTIYHLLSSVILSSCHPVILAHGFFCQISKLEKSDR